ncbi:Nn.00g081800.m01.CDS01 [Neocucurbitaria sp. VM-36]
MASQKRKRTSTRRESNKRPKYTTSSETEHTPNASGEWWEAECILEERRRGGKRQYLIQWKGIDPVTGQEYPPNWEPEECANELLLESWEQEKAGKGVAIPTGNTGSSVKRKGCSKGQQQAHHTPRRNCKSRAVRSSPEPSTARSSSLPTVPSTPARDSATPTADYSTVTTPISASKSPQRPSPRIQIAPRRNSFNPEDFDRFSQIAASQLATTPSCTQETDLDSSQLIEAKRPFSSGIVPDSQSSAGEASFIPITQQTGYSSQQSTVTNDSQDEEQVTEDSVRLHNSRLKIDVCSNKKLQGILEIVQAASRAISPARSIPETVPDTGVDTQSQHRRTDTEAPRVISETLVTIESSSQAAHAVADVGGHNLAFEYCQQATSEWVSERRREEPTTREDNTLQDSVEGASQPAPESTSQALIHYGDQQEEHGTATELQAASSKSAAVADEAVENAQIVPGSSPILIDSGPSQSRQPEEDLTASKSTRQPTDDKAHEISKPQSCPQVGPRDSHISSAEQVVNEKNVQSPLHSQQSSRRQSCAPEDDFSAQGTAGVEFGGSAVPQTQPAEILVQASVESVTIPESSGDVSQQAELSLHSLKEGGELLVKTLEPRYTHISLLIVENQPLSDRQDSDLTADSNRISQIDTEDTVRRRDFALSSHAPRSSVQSTESREQNAQVLLVEPDFSTQEEITQSIRPTVEEEYVPNRASSESRHDSSQETPERRLRSVENSSSPIPQPPSHSLDLADSKLPSRPTTPGHITSSSNMASHDTGEEVAQQLKERLAKRQAENPYTPTRRIIRSSLTPSATAPTPESSAAAPTSARRFLEANALPSANVAEGTRSPSTVPDRSPAPQAPTSLRTVAFAPTSTISVAEPHERELTSYVGEPPEQADNQFMVTSGEPAVPLHMPASTGPEDEELSDIDDDDESESLFNDDLNLEREEYIVPLFIEGRQSDMFSEHLKHKQELVERFIKDPSSFDELAPVEEVLSHLRALETHIDLVFAEAEPASWLETSSGTQVEFAAQFGMENSTKFRFLHTLFHHLRDKDKHIVLVTANDNGALFDILEMFCKAKFINYNIPTKGRQAIPMNVEGALTITILPGDGDSPPIIRAPDLVICLDGFQEASQIRQKNWARSSNQDIVPVLHLVIPRSVGHIERYVSPALNHRERLHTTLASLAQMHGDIGKPIDEDTPRAPVAAEMVVDWLVAANDDEGLSWPLPSIGSIKNVIEYQTQLSQTSQTSATSPAPERNKRPLDDDELDSAKRMRFTPQPYGIASSSINEHEVTHISDSMPGTAVDISGLRRQLAQTEETYQKERAARKAEEQRFRDHEEMWDKQQTVHENLTREYRLLLGQQKSTEEKLETMTRNNETLRERLASRTAEMRQLNDQLEEQRATHLLSKDEQIAEITRLRKELAAAQEEKQRALKNAQTTESTLEYTKEQYRLAQDAATSSQSIIEELNASNAKLQHQASGQPAKLKALHLDRQAENQDKLIKSLRAENTILKRTLGQKEDELQRVRNNPGRAGVGTRAQSVTPQPKVRSRAASPMGGRLSNLRNG